MINNPEHVRTRAFFLMLLLLNLFLSACSTENDQSESTNRNFYDMALVTSWIEQFCATPELDISELQLPVTEAETVSNGGFDTSSILEDPTTQYTIFESGEPDAIFVGPATIMTLPPPDFSISSYYASILNTAALTAYTNQDLNHHQAHQWLTRNNGAAITVNNSIAAYLDGNGVPELSNQTGWNQLMSTAMPENSAYFAEVISAISSEGIGTSGKRFQILGVSAKASQVNVSNILRTVFHIVDTQTGQEFFLKVQSGKVGIREFQALTLLRESGFPSDSIAEGIVFRPNTAQDLTFTLTKAVENSGIVQSLDLYDFILDGHIASMTPELQAVVRQNVLEIYNASLRTYARTGAFPTDLLDRSGTNILVNMETGQLTIIDGIAVRVTGKIDRLSNGQIEIFGDARALVMRMRRTLRMLDIPEPVLTDDLITHTTVLPGGSVSVAIIDELGQPKSNATVTNSSDTSLSVPKWFTEKNLQRFNTAMAILGSVAGGIDLGSRLADTQFTADSVFTVPSAGSLLSMRGLNIDDPYYIETIPDPRALDTYALAFDQLLYQSQTRAMITDLRGSLNLATGSENQHLELITTMNQRRENTSLQLCSANSANETPRFVYVQPQTIIDQSGNLVFTYQAVEFSIDSLPILDSIQSLDSVDLAIHASIANGADVFTVLQQYVDANQIGGYSVDSEGNIFYFTGANIIHPNPLIEAGNNLVIRYIYTFETGSEPTLLKFQLNEKISRVQ